jgi:hypothetical protein
MLIPAHFITLIIAGVLCITSISSLKLNETKLERSLNLPPLRVSSLLSLPPELLNITLLDAARAHDSKTLANILASRLDIAILLLKSHDRSIYDKFPAAVAQLMLENGNVKTLNTIFQYPQLVNWKSHEVLVVNDRQYVLSPGLFSNLCMKIDAQVDFQIKNERNEGLDIILTFIQHHLAHIKGLLFFREHRLSYKNIINFYISSLIKQNNLTQLGHLLTFETASELQLGQFMNLSTLKAMISSVIHHLEYKSLQKLLNVGEDMFKAGPATVKSYFAEAMLKLIEDPGSMIPPSGLRGQDENSVVSTFLSILYSHSLFRNFEYLHYENERELKLNALEFARKIHDDYLTKLILKQSA